MESAQGAQIVTIGRHVAAGRVIGVNRCGGEPPFSVVKILFMHRNSRHLGLAKINKQHFTQFCLANLVLAR